MKKIQFIFLIFLCSLNCISQNLYLKINGNSDIENKIIDSLGYNKNHSVTKSIVEEINLLSDKLTKIGYIENQVLNSEVHNDTVFIYKLNLKDRVYETHIYLNKNSILNSLTPYFKTNDTLIIPYSETENYLNKTINLLEKKGYPLAKLNLDNIKKENKHLIAKLSIQLNNYRKINDIVIRGYDKFPIGHQLVLAKNFKNKPFNQDNLKKIYDRFNTFRFVKQLKYPEILFEKDTTKIYVYLEKTKSNSFDGFVGFSNNTENKITLNGYLDLNLINTLNSGENLKLLWKSDGNQQKNFNVSLEIPYIFKSSLGIKTQLNFFKQDSLFQNTKTAIDLGYMINYTTRIYFGYQSTESSDIQNKNSTTISDFKNSFATSNFEFIDYKNESLLFTEKTKINLKLGIGSRNSTQNKNNQFFISSELKHDVYLNEKNSFNIKSQNYLLKSESYLNNELYRFGGINSIRGFRENSLQANLLASILTEYRYMIAQTIYVHTIIDYAYYQDITNKNQGDLFGFGFGFGIATKNGLLNLIYANGSSQSQSIKDTKSIVHVSFKTKF